MLQAAEAISAFIAGTDRDSFAEDDLLRSAVLHKLQVIGEAASHVGEDVRRASPDIPWAQVVGFRNVTVHAYFSVDWGIVWTTATWDAPAIAEAIRTLLSGGRV